MKNLIKSGIFAGICISIGGLVNLAVGGVAGAMLFSFGLITVCMFGLNLFTGMAGAYTDYKGTQNTDISRLRYNIMLLPCVLLFNIIGCICMGTIGGFSDAFNASVICNAQNIISGRICAGIVPSFMSAIGCGIIMRVCVYLYRTNISSSTLKATFPILIGIPVFILCGFPHCVADAFYFFMQPMSVICDTGLQYLPVYISIVLGNYIGCNALNVLQ